MAATEGDDPFPGVLIAPEADGVDEFQASRAETFCELGYAALALDYYGDGRVLGDPGEVSRQLEALGSDPDAIRARAIAALDVLLADFSTATSVSGH